VTLWARVRDEVLRRTHHLGRQVALGLVGAMQATLARDGRVFVLGNWRRVFAALGLREPCAKAGLAALRLLAAATTAVVRVTSHTWRVVSHAADAATAEQLELALGTGTDGKAESEPKHERVTPAPPRRDPRTLARSLALEGAFGPRPRSVAARVLAARVEEATAVGKAWAVTLTTAIDDLAEGAARAFASRLADPSGAAMIPERSPSGRVHFHGVAIGTAAEVAAALVQSGAGSTEITEIKDLRRLRYWAGYVWKGPAEDLDPITSGVLAAEPPDEPPALGREPHEAAERSVLARAWDRIRGLWQRWRGRAKR
jgi:hypothetical protein